MADRIWISWETQRRNRSLSPYVCARLFELDFNTKRWHRYPLAIWKTLTIFSKENPDIIFSQNPSMVLAVLSIAYAKLFNKKIVIDAHNAGLFPLEGKSRLLNRIAVKLTQWSTLTIVSNTSLANRVTYWGGESVAIPDPFPNLEPPGMTDKLKNSFNVLYICSWSADEPINAVLDASIYLEAGVSIYMTGNSKGLENTYIHGVPRSIELTGYVNDDEFTRLLYASDAVMVLTTREDCLLCGAYEGVSAGKPLILSDTAALRNYFSEGSVFVGNTALSIREGINEVRRNYPQYADRVQALKQKREMEFNVTIDNFNRVLKTL